MQSLSIYKRAFEEDYTVLFVDVWILNIVADMMLHNFSAAESRATYMRHIGVGDMMIKNQGMLLFLVKLRKNASAVKAFGILYLYDPNLYISSVEEVFSQFRS